MQTSLLRDNRTQTIVKLRMIAQNQQLLRADFDQAPTQSSLQQGLQTYREQLAGADVIILSDYGKGGLHHVATMIEAAKRKNIPVVVDPKGTDFTPYSGATMLTPNMQEFELVVGGCTSEADFIAKAQALRTALKLDYLLVTRSEQGMSLFGDKKQHIHSAAKVHEVYDVSGAGDTVIAMMALALVSEFDISNWPELANTAAGIVVGKIGTAVVTIDELIEGVN